MRKFILVQGYKGMGFRYEENWTLDAKNWEAARKEAAKIISQMKEEDPVSATVLEVVKEEKINLETI